MPAAAVTPAPEAYIKVVAVKKLVVGSGLHGRTLRLVCCIYSWCGDCLVSWLCDLSAVSVYSGAS